MLHVSWVSLDRKTVGFFLKISKDIGTAWRKSLTRRSFLKISKEIGTAWRKSSTRAKRASLGLTARGYLNTQKYGLFCSLGYLVL